MKKNQELFGRLIFAGILLFSPTGCIVGIVDLDSDVNSGEEEASQLFSRVLGVDTQVSIRIIGLNGAIKVRGVEGTQEVTVRAERRVRSETLEDAQEHLHLVQVLLHVGRDQILIETDQPRHTGGRSYLVDYEITVPSDLDVVVTNGNGPVQLEDLRSDVRLETGNGDVTILALSGSSWVTVGNGTVNASVDLPLGGNAVYVVGNGTMVFSVQPDVSAQLNARVGNGSISVTGLELVNPVSAPNLFSSLLGSGAGLIDLTVGNGWVQVKGR